MTLSMELPTELVERAVRDKINAAIASQLGDPSTLITKLVGATLSQKVNSKGQRSGNSYENKYEFMEVIAGNFIRSAAKEAISEFFNENREIIKKAVKAEVVKSSKDVAKVIVDGLTTSLNSSYSSKVEIKFTSSED